MAQDTQSTDPSGNEVVKHVQAPVTSEKAFAYLVMRLLLGLLLICAGAEKFKSPETPYFFDRRNWHGEKNPVTGLYEGGRWGSVAKPVFDYSGFNNVDNYPKFLQKPGKEGHIGPNTVSRVFYYFAHLLPYLMIGSGILIFIGLFNRLALTLGGLIWMSLAVGQAMLPDNATVMMLSLYTLYHAVALALVRNNRYAITRG